MSIRAQVLNLPVSLRPTLGLTYVFKSDDLGVVHHMAEMMWLTKGPAMPFLIARNILTLRRSSRRRRRSTKRY